MKPRAVLDTSIVLSAERRELLFLTHRKLSPETRPMVEPPLLPQGSFQAPRRCCRRIARPSKIAPRIVPPPSAPGRPHETLEAQD
jgi:hypothetical protein